MIDKYDGDPCNPALRVNLHGRDIVCKIVCNGVASRLRSDAKEAACSVA